MAAGLVGGNDGRAGGAGEAGERGKRGRRQAAPSRKGQAAAVCTIGSWTPEKARPRTRARWRCRSSSTSPTGENGGGAGDEESVCERAGMLNAARLQQRSGTLVGKRRCVEDASRSKTIEAADRRGTRGREAVQQQAACSGQGRMLKKRRLGGGKEPL